MNRLNELREKANLTKNQLAQLAGLSASHITSLENRIEKARRDTLISVGLYLCNDLESMNDLLSEYDEAAITELDANYFVQAAYRRKLNGTQMIYSNRISLYTLLLSLENLGGNEIFVHNRVSNRFGPEKYITLRNQRRGIEDRVLKKIIEIFVQQRQKKLEENLVKYSKQYTSHHLICEKCFKEHIHEADNSPEEREFITSLIQNLLVFMKKFDNFNFSLLSECPKFNFEMKSFDSKENNDIVFLLGRIKEQHEIRTDNNPESLKDTFDALFGFVTDSFQFSSTFLKEYNRLKNSILPECKSKEKTIQYILSTVKKETGIIIS